MPKAKNLITLLKIPHGDNGKPQEHNVREYIKSQVKGIKQDSTGNLYLIYPNTPIVCAHMDNVGTAEAQKHLHNIKIDSSGIIKGTHNMGADDKVGIFIALELHKRLGNKVSLIFTIAEETGGIGAERFDKSLIDTNTYMVVPDRYGRTDVIATNNDYCTEEFENAIMPHLGKFGFKSNTGVRCDADKFNENINCINIACGYMAHHTDNEYVVWQDTVNTIEALTVLMQQDIKRMKAPEPYKYLGMGYGYARSRDNYYYGDGSFSGTMLNDNTIMEPTGEYISSSVAGKLVNIWTGKTIDIPAGDRELYIPEQRSAGSIDKQEETLLGFYDRG